LACENNQFCTSHTLSLTLACSRQTVKLAKTISVRVSATSQTLISLQLEAKIAEVVANAAKLVALRTENQSIDGVSWCRLATKHCVNMFLRVVLSTGGNKTIGQVEICFCTQTLIV